MSVVWEDGGLRAASIGKQKNHECFLNLLSYLYHPSASYWTALLAVWSSIWCIVNSLCLERLVMYAIPEIPFMFLVILDAFPDQHLLLVMKRHFCQTERFYRYRRRLWFSLGWGNAVLLCWEFRWGWGLEVSEGLSLEIGKRFKGKRGIRNVVFF